MIKNKRGLSTIVVTVIMIALVLVAIGVVWGVLNNVIGKGAKGVELSAKCLNIDVSATSVSCSGGPLSCTAQLERTGSGTDAIAGVKLVFKNSTQSASGVLTEAGNIEVLAGKTLSLSPTGITDPNKVEITVYFEDTAGNPQYCPQPSSFEF